MDSQLFHHVQSHGRRVEFASVEIPGEIWADLEEHDLTRQFLRTSMPGQPSDLPGAPCCQGFVVVADYIKFCLSRRNLPKHHPFRLLSATIEDAKSLGYDYLMITT